MKNPSSYSKLIKDKARSLGFDYCGIAKAEFLTDEAPLLESWLKKGMHGNMHYMSNHFDKRLDPRKLVEGTKSVISLLLNYYPKESLPSEHYKVSKYAYGEDYHEVIREKLNKLLQHIQEVVGDVHGRGFVDSAPVMDKAWAKKAGTGWVGKNTNLINKNSGSFFFIANLLLDLELEYDGPVADYCGTCTRCIDACPTDAITSPYVVDGSRCISYLTIELKDQIPAEFKNKMDNWIFGCDICQDVCPWNRFARPHHETSFNINKDWKTWKKEDWEEMSEEIFKIYFKKSAIKRTKWSGIKRNINFIKD